MGWSRKLTKWVSTSSLISGLLVTLLSPLVANLATLLGLADPVSANSIVAWIHDSLSNIYVQLGSAALIGFTLGMWTDVVFAHIEKRRTQEIQQLGQRSVSHGKAISNAFSESSLDGPHFGPLVHSTEVLLLRLSKIGFVTPVKPPSFNDFQDREEYYIRVLHYLDAVGRLLEEGFEKEARIKASEMLT